MTHYGLTRNEDYSLWTKNARQMLLVWSGPFYGQYEGYALSPIKGGKNWTIKLEYIDEPIKVEGPHRATDDTYKEVSEIINAAINARFPDDDNVEDVNEEVGE